jgi:hypothetical protein
MAKRNVDDAVEAFLNGGGKVVRLQYASEKEVRKASRVSFHKDRATTGSEASKQFLKRREDKEASLIFSREDRWKR